MTTFLADLRFGLRMFTRRPGLALTAVLTLALGIGANAAIFSVVEAVLLRPLPFREPDRLVMVWERNYKRDRPRNVVNPGNYMGWKERNHVFEDIAGLSPYDINLSGEGEATRLRGGAVTANLFSVLGVSAELGRTFLPEDGTPGAPDVVLLSHGLWQRRFGADPAVLGRSVNLFGRPATVVGVMPARTDVPPGAELWVPLTINDSFRTARGRWMATVARLKPGVSVEQARAEMDGIASVLERERPDFNSGWGVTVAPLHSDLVTNVRPAVMVLMGAVALVLLIACANVANLLLARSLAREREIAVRTALGASRGRLVRQLLTESLLLGAAGGAAGLFVARWTLAALTAALPAEIPTFMTIGLNAPVLGFAAFVALSTAAVSGLVPALRLARPSLGQSLKEGSAAAGAGRERRRVARALIVAEVALALVLLVGAGLFVRSFGRLIRVDPGFRAEGVTSFQISLPRAGYEEPSRRQQFFGQLLDSLRGLPGVVSASAMSWRPLGVGSATSFELPDRATPPAGEEPVADVRFVTDDLFQTLAIPVKSGRTFTDRDGPDAPKVVIVNETLAREAWPGVDPVGRRIRMEWGEMLDAEVVGVVGDVRLTAIDTRARATLYWPHTQTPSGSMTVMVRSGLSPAALAPALKAAVTRLDANLPVAEIKDLRQVVADSLDRPRFLFAFAAAFAGTAVLLAAVGMFGVLAHSVGQRLPELALRVALGATRRDILRLVLGEGLALTLLGLGIGLIGAFSLSRLLAGMLYETSPGDPLTYVAVALVLGAAAMLASAIPAWRALRVEPASTLRAE